MYSWLKTASLRQTGVPTASTTLSVEQPASAEEPANSLPTKNTDCDSLAAYLMAKPSEYSSAVKPAVPIFEVAFKNGMWWSIPADISQQMYEKYENNEDVGYTWDWGDSPYGSWQPDGEQTSINRYVIDFTTWEQRNVDNDRRRSVRLVWVAAERVDPKWTGEIPDTGGQS